MKCLRCGKSIEVLKCPRCGFTVNHDTVISLFPMTGLQREAVCSQNVAELNGLQPVEGENTKDRRPIDVTGERQQMMPEPPPV